MRIRSIVLLFIFIIACCGSTLAAESSSRMKIGHLHPPGSAIDQDIRVFIDTVNKETDHAFPFDIYPGIIRVPPIKSFELTTREMGYTPYPITWTYAKMGLKTGMVSGIIGGGAEGYSGLKDFIKYYIPVNDHL